MKPIHLLIALIAIFTTPLSSFSQDSLIVKLARKNLKTFTVNKETFSGNAWDTLVNQVRKSDFVLIGEDHFTNEIPFFTSAITNKVKFDNFIVEIDPYSAKILESKIKNLPEPQLKKYSEDFGHMFCFYSMASEFKLMKDLVKANTSLYGIDQILMNADRLIANGLKSKTKNPTAKKIYEDIEQKSKTHFDNFLKDPSKPMYMLTDDFEKQTTELLKLNLSPEEKEKVNALKLSAKIYKTMDHHLRVQLLKNELMKIYPKWVNKKNLFKYGAGHLPKGESFLTVNDIGNLVDNIADSQFKNSLHILIVGKSGKQASPFKGFPAQAVDADSNNLKPLKPFFSTVEGTDWHYFDMLPIRKALEDGKITVNDIGLARIIKGFDVLIIIPEVTASKFPE